MPITNATTCKFFFNSTSQFSQKLTDGTLLPGSLYFVGMRVYLALTGNTYQQFGTFRSVSALPDASTAEENVIYYNQTSKLISTAISGVWQHLNNAVVSVRTSGDNVYLIKADGTEVNFALPPAGVAFGFESNIVSANADGGLERSAYRIVNIFDTIPTSYFISRFEFPSESTGIAISENSVEIVSKTPTDWATFTAASPFSVSGYTIYTSDNTMFVKYVGDTAPSVTWTGDQGTSNTPVTFSAVSAAGNIPNEPAIKTFVRAEISNVPMGMRPVASLNASTETTFPASPEIGDFWRIAAAGTIDTIALTPGDWLVWTKELQWDVWKGVENPTVDNLLGIDPSLPLAATQGAVIQGKLDEKINKVAPGHTGEILIAQADGGAMPSGYKIVDQVSDEPTYNAIVSLPDTANGSDAVTISSDSTPLFTGTLSNLIAVSPHTTNGWEIVANGTTGSVIEVELICNSKIVPHATITTASLVGSPVSLDFSTDDYGDPKSLVNEQGLRNFVASQVGKGIQWIID